MKTDSLQVFGLCNVYYDSYYIKGLQDYFDVKKIAVLLNSKTKRENIETNAKVYFETYLSPEKVIENLYNTALK